MRSAGSGSRGGGGSDAKRSWLPPTSILVANPVMTALACMCKYRSICQLFQRPMRRMRWPSTPAQNKAIAPVVRKQPTVTSLGEIPSRSFDRAASRRRASVKSRAVSCRSGIPGCGWYEHKGVVSGAPALRRAMICSATATMGHALLVPLRVWPTFSPRTPLFCVVKVRVMNVAPRSWASVERRRFNVEFPAFNITSQKRNGWGDSPLRQNSPGLIRKKNATHMRLASANDLGVPWARNRCETRCNSSTGIGWRREGSGS